MLIIKESPPGGSYEDADWVRWQKAEFFDVQYTIWGVQASYQDLVEWITLPLYAVDTTSSQTAGAYIQIPDRDYRERKNGEIYLLPHVKRWNRPKPPKLVAQNIPSVSSDHALALRVDVEIVAVYKRQWETFTAESAKVQHARNLLLHCVSDEAKRDFLLHQKDQAKLLFDKIEVAHKTRNMSEKLESQAKNFYNLILDTIRQSPLDDVMLAALSWENFPEMPIYSSYPYACRIWVVYNIFFRLLKRK